MGDLLDEYKQELAVRQTEPDFNKETFKTNFLQKRGIDHNTPKPTIAEKEVSNSTGLPVSRGFAADIASATGRGFTGAAEMWLRAVRTIDQEGGKDVIRDFATGGIDAIQGFIEKHPFLKPSKEAESGFRRAATEGVSSFIESASAIIPGLPLGVVGGAVTGAAVFAAAEHDRVLEEVEDFIINNNLTESQADDLREKGKGAAVKSAAVEGGFELAANTLTALTLGLFRPFKGSAKEGVKATFKSLFEKPGSALVRGGKAYAKTALTEVSTETAQEALETKFRRDIGITDMSSLDAAMSVIGPTLVTSALFLGTTSGLNARDRSNIKKKLLDAETKFSPVKRKEAVDAIVAEVSRKDKKQGALLRKSAYAYIDSGAAINMETDVNDIASQMVKDVTSGALHIDDMQRFGQGVEADNPELSKNILEFTDSYKLQNNIPDIGQTAMAGEEQDLADTMVNGGDVNLEDVVAGTDDVIDAPTVKKEKKLSDKEVDAELSGEEPRVEALYKMGITRPEEMAPDQLEEELIVLRQVAEGFDPTLTAVVNQRIDKITSERSRREVEGEPKLGPVTEEVKPKAEVVKPPVVEDKPVEAKPVAIEAAPVAPDFFTTRKGKFVKVEGEQVLKEKGDFFIHAEEGRFVVVDGKTGVNIGEAKGREEAIAAATSLINRPDFAEIQKRAIDEGNVSPRFGGTEDIVVAPTKAVLKPGELNFTQAREMQELRQEIRRADNAGDVAAKETATKEFAAFLKRENIPDPRTGEVAAVKEERRKPKAEIKEKPVKEEKPEVVEPPKVKEKPTKPVKEKPKKPTKEKEAEATTIEKELVVASEEDIDKLIAGLEPTVEEKPKKIKGPVKVSEKKAKEKPTLKKAAKELSEGVKESFAAIHELLKPGGIKMGVGFDEEAYSKFKPHLTKAWQNYSAAGHTLLEYGQLVVDEFGNRIKPLLGRFLKDQKAGLEGELIKPVVAKDETTVDTGKPEKLKRKRLKDVGEVVPGKRSQKDNFERIKDDIVKAETGNTNKDLNKILNNAQRSKLWLIDKADRPNATPGAVRYIKFVRDSAMSATLYTSDALGGKISGTAKEHLERYALIEDKPGDRKGYKVIADHVARYQNSIEMLNAATATANSTQEAYDNIVKLVVKDTWETGDNPMFHLSKEGREITDVFSWNNAHSFFSPRSLAAMIKEENLDRPEPKQLKRIRVAISQLIRENTDNWRKDKPNPTAQEFIDKFGFRATEFGEWVDSKSGHHHLNLAWDSFHDLAQVLGIETKDVSVIDQTERALAMAFGARGRGKHAAHYEGQNHLINMTKENGDGSLAHEWGHAIDAALSGETGGFGSAAISDLMNALETKYNIERAKAEVEKILSGNSYWTQRTTRTPIQVAKRFLETEWERHIKETTDFTKEARKLGTKYWDKRSEKFARAFESFVYDGLKGSSPYLVSSFVDGKTTTAARGYPGNPYPTGEEREQFNRIFRHLFDGMEWVDNKPKMKEGYELVTEKERLRAEAELKKISDKLEDMFAAMHQGKPSKDGLYWYSYKTTKRAAMMQPKNFNAYDDKFGDNGAVGYTEALLPDDILYFKLKATNHDEDANKVYLEETTDGPDDRKGDQLDTAGLEGEGSLGEAQAEDGEGVKTGVGVQDRPDTRTGKDDDGPSELSPGGGTRPSGVGQGVTDVDTTAGGAGIGELELGHDAVLGGGNYRITESDRLGQGSLNEKFTNNIAAIRTLKAIEGEGRNATAEEQAVLVRYVGWGGLSKAFDEFAGEGWKDKFDIVKQTLNEEEIKAGRASTLSAFYTSPEVVGSMYTALEKFGFKGGRILEPALGTGNFFGLLPEAIQAGTQLAGVEMDNISARIAKQLYQKATVFNSPYEKSQLPRNFYDAAISNVPFVSVIPFDKVYNKKRFQLHDYYFNKTLSLVRPGGIVAFITSAGTMDKADSKARKAMAEKAEFVGAIRLPDTAFKDAGTKVTADIIFLRRKGGEGKALPEQKWMDVKEYGQSTQPDPDSLFKPGGTTSVQVNINEYFAKNPEMMLGTMEKSGQWEKSQNLVSDGRDIDAALTEAVDKLPTDIYKEAEAIVELNIADMIPDPTELIDGSFYEEGGNTYIHVAGGEAIKLESKTPFHKLKIKRIKAFIKIRNARRAMLKAQAQEKPAAEIKKLTKVLNKAYDDFVKSFGFLNLPVNLRAFLGDPEDARVLALENWEAETETATKSDIFFKRFIENLKPITSVKRPADGLPHSLNTFGRVDIPFIAKLSSFTEDEVIAELEGQIWNDPEKGWVTSDEYLSGNIKEKIALAKQAAKTDPIYKKNIEALTPLIPEDLPPSEIRAQLGAPWIEAGDVQAFIRELIPQGTGFHVDYVPELGKWSVVPKSRWSKADADRQAKIAKRSVAATATWGTGRKNFFTLLNHILNGGLPTVKIQGTDQVDPLGTAAAQAKLEAIKEKFSSWLWADDARMDKYVRKYNDVYNGTQERKYNGDHLTFPGKVPDDIITLTKHQKDAVWRAITSGLNAYFAHEVGTGKTYAMAATVMEAKRMGLKKKPMILGKKANIDELAENFVKLYPAARILRLDVSQNAFKRKVQLNRIANNDWDAVIISHDSFKNIQLSPEGKSEALEEELGNLRLALDLAKSNGSANFTIKEIETKIATLAAAQEKIQAAVDESKIDLDFEELGVDMLVVDEAHEFKNIPYATSRSNIVGISGTGSGMAFDLYQKTRWVNEKYGGGVLLASGTPVTNSVSEIYNIGKYLNPQTLKDKGIHTFDAWTAAFGNVTQTPEFAPEGGGYRMVLKFKEFVNIPELRAIVREVVDVVSVADIDLKVPKMLDGKPIPIVIPQNEQQEALGQEMLIRASDIRGGGVQMQPRHPDKVDIMLSVISDGRNGAIDMRLIDPDLPEAPQTKVSTAVKNIFQSYKASKEMKGTQLVFADRGVPGTIIKFRDGAPVQKKDKAGKPMFRVEKKKDPETGKPEVVKRLTDAGALVTSMLPVYETESKKFDVYNDMKNKLIKMGIPAGEIAFARDHKSTKLKKKQFFNKVNKGDIRVIIGSTDDMGVGVNVQERGVALHNLDTEWTFEKLEQRRGRFIRQGNIMEVKGLPVAVFNYMTEGTVDAFMWDKVAAKKVTTEVVLFGNSSQRTVEDVSQEGMSAQEMMAFASGDPRFLHKIELEAEVRKLNAVKDNNLNEKYRLRRELGGIPGEIESFETGIQFRKQALEFFGGANAIKVKDVIYDLKRHSKEIGEMMDKLFHTDNIARIAKAGEEHIPTGVTFGHAATEEIDVEEEVETTEKGKVVKKKVMKKKKIMTWEGNDIPMYVRSAAGFTSGKFKAKSTADLKIGTKTKYGEYEMIGSGTPAQLLANTKASLERESKENSELIEQKKKKQADIEAEIAKPFEQEEETLAKNIELKNLTAELGQILQEQQELQGRIDPDLERFKSKPKDVTGLEDNSIKKEEDQHDKDIKLSVKEISTIKDLEKEYYGTTEELGRAVVNKDSAEKQILEDRLRKIEERLEKANKVTKTPISGTTKPGSVVKAVYRDLFDQAEKILGMGKTSIEIKTTAEIAAAPGVEEALEELDIDITEVHKIKGAYQASEVKGVAAKGVIVLSMDGISSLPDMEATTRHEMFHGVFEHLLNEKDRKIIFGKFGDEENAADAFAKYLTNREGPIDGSVKQIFERLINFFNSLANVIRGRGFNSAGDIFGQAAMGNLINKASVNRDAAGIAFKIEEGMPEQDLTAENVKAKVDFNKFANSTNPLMKEYAEAMRSVVTQNPHNVLANKDRTSVVDEIYKSASNNDIKFTQRVFGLPWFLARKFKEWNAAVGIELKREEDKNMIMTEFNKKQGKLEKGEKDIHEIMNLKRHEEQGVLEVIYEGDGANREFTDLELSKGIKLTTLGELDNKFKNKTVKLSEKQKGAYKAWVKSSKAMRARLVEAIDDMTYRAYKGKPWEADLKDLVKHHEETRRNTKEGTSLTEGEIPGKLDEEQRDEFRKAFNKVMPRQIRIAELRRQIGEIKGYAPRVREGRFAVKAITIPDSEGNIQTLWHERTDKERETRGMIKEQIDKFEKQGLKHGVDFTVTKELNDKASEFIFDQIQAVSVERFINKALNRAKTGEKISNADIEAVTTEMITLLSDEFKSRGFGSTMMKRQRGFPIGGYKIDNIKTRYASYISGASGYMTKQTAAYDYANLIRSIDITKTPDLYEDIARYSGDMLRNQTRLDRVSGVVRSAAFVWYLAGQLKSPVVNFTQNWILGIPLLEKTMGKGAKGAYHKAMADVARRKYSADERKFIDEMAAKGITGDQLTKEITGQSESEAGKSLTNTVRMLALPFSLSEIYNRKVAGLAAYRAFKEKGLKGEELFAATRKFVFDVHFLYGKLNAPSGARGGSPGAVILRTSLTFRNYTFNFIHSLKDMLSERDFKTVAKAMTYMALLGGASALPFLDGFLDMLERITGTPWRKNVKKELENVAGPVLANVGVQGLPALLGADISGSLRIHFPDVTQPGKLIEESVFGVYEGLALKAAKSVQAVGTGQFTRAFETAAPVFIERPMKAFREREGMTTTRGKPIQLPTGQQIEPTVGESIATGLGFRPSRLARLSDNYRQYGNIKKFYMDWRSKIYTEFRLATTAEGRQKVIQQVVEYNREASAHDGAITTIGITQLKQALKLRIDKRFAAFSAQ